MGVQLKNLIDFYIYTCHNSNHQQQANANNEMSYSKVAIKVPPFTQPPPPPLRTQPPPPPPRIPAPQYPFTFVLTGSSFARRKVAQYVNQNTPFWQKSFLDPTLTITPVSMSDDTTFLTVTTENDFVVNELIDTVLRKLEEAVDRTHSKYKEQGDVDLDIMYRHKGIRTDIYMKAGEVAGYSEYVLQNP